MQLLTEIPEDAKDGSMWLVFRESGAATQVILIDGVLHAGSSSIEIDIKYREEAPDVSVFDPIMLYARLVRPHDL